MLRREQRKTRSKQTEEEMQKELRQARHETDLARLATEKAIEESRVHLVGFLADMTVEQRIDYVDGIEGEIEDLKDRVLELEKRGYHTFTEEDGTEHRNPDWIEPEDITWDLAAAWFQRAGEDDRKRFVKSVGISEFSDALTPEEYEEELEKSPDERTALARSILKSKGYVIEEDTKAKKSVKAKRAPRKK